MFFILACPLSGHIWRASFTSPSSANSAGRRGVFLHCLTGCIYTMYVVRGSRNKRLLVVALWLGRPVKQVWYFRMDSKLGNWPYPHCTSEWCDDKPMDLGYLGRSTMAESSHSEHDWARALAARWTWYFQDFPNWLMNFRRVQPLKPQNRSILFWDLFWQMQIASHGDTLWVLRASMGNDNRRN